ncbi:hypothetical protein OS189_11825 [Sulfitobacter sp. F26169L]|uniref:hypothetical protein n=1 Tax=Sulfitobacter sp. F26169L TaxID=2996015 RepID=UPI0022609953|nr:hypothetical protein [Sulfitobacter sp. F26169L]MCX7567031.1 hypothetical protein [Sulfitobacter sp. F26169L]
MGAKSDLQVRKATVGDVAAIAHIWHMGWHQEHAKVVSADLVPQRAAREFEKRTSAHLDHTQAKLMTNEIASFSCLYKPKYTSFV